MRASGRTVGAAVAVLLWAGAAVGAMSPSQFIQEISRDAIDTLRQPGTSLEHREQAFRQILYDRFDLPFIGRFVLGQYWRDATVEQRQDFDRLFALYVLKTYSQRLGGYAGETMTVVSVRQAGTVDVVVRTRIDRPGGSPISADWRVRTSDGKNKIVDVMVEGISMALTQRQEFAAVIQRHGLDGLIEILRARTGMVTVSRAN